MHETIAEQEARQRKLREIVADRLGPVMAYASGDDNRAREAYAEEMGKPVPEDECPAEALLQSLHEGCLCVDIHETFDVLLTFGGPTAGFKLQRRPQEPFSRGVFYTTQLGEYQEWNLSDDEMDAIAQVYGLDIH